MHHLVPSLFREATGPIRLLVHHRGLGAIENGMF